MEIHQEVCIFLTHIGRTDLSSAVRTQIHAM